MIPGAISPSEVTRNGELMGHPIPSEFWSEMRHECLLDEKAPVPA